MVLILGWVIIGAGVAIALTSFLSGRGAGGSTAVNLIAGVVGGFVGGYVFLLLGPSVVGVGPDFLFSLLGAAVLAVAAVLIASKVVK